MIKSNNFLAQSIISNKAFDKASSFIKFYGSESGKISDTFKVVEDTIATSDFKQAEIMMSTWTRIFEEELEKFNK